MTIENENIVSGPYTGNGVTASFDYTFRVDDKTEIIVYETTSLGVESILVVDTNYTVNNIGTDGGGTIDRIAGALPTGYTWYIRSNRDATQLTSFESQGGFFPSVHERAFDKLTVLVLELKDKIARALRFPDSYSGGASLELPTPSAGKALKWNATADAIENTTTDIDVGFSDLSTAVADAQAAQAAAEAVFDAFDDTYLGAKASAPTVDNDGNTLQDGAMYFDTTLNLLRVYDLGTASWISIPVTSLSSLTDVTLTSIVTGEILKWNGTAWINQTLSEAGIVEKTSDTGSMRVPAGTVAQQPASPSFGDQRANLDTSTMEWYNGFNWVNMGGGATGGGTDEVFFMSAMAITENFTVPVGFTAITGDTTIADGFTVTVNNGAKWSSV